MMNDDNNSISVTLDEIRARAVSCNITAHDLREAEKVAAALSEDENPDLRRRFCEVLESMESCGILSRPDSHHWDRGLCALESETEVICAAEGIVLCFDGETAAAYSPEEVRAIGGAKF